MIVRQGSAISCGIHQLHGVYSSHNWDWYVILDEVKRFAPSGQVLIFSDTTHGHGALFAEWLRTQNVGEVTQVLPENHMNPNSDNPIWMWVWVYKRT